MTKPAAFESVYLVDISKHQFTDRFNWHAAALDISGVFVRASVAYAENDKQWIYIDPRYKNHINNIEDAGLITGAYHYFRGDCDLERQLATFIRAFSMFPHALGAWLDVEEPNNTKASQIRWMCDEFKKRTGQTLNIYSRRNVLDRLRWPINPQERNYWLAYYPFSKIGNEHEQPRLMAWVHTAWIEIDDYPIRKDTKFWQWTPRGDFLWDRACCLDVNIYNGTQAEFDIEFGLTTPQAIDAKNGVKPRTDWRKRIV